jgi:hypothetical protein
MEDTPLTPIEESRSKTGRRNYAVNPATYSVMASGVDAIRGYPHGEGTKAQTLRGLSPVDSLPVANDGSGDVLVSLETWRFVDADDQMLAPAIAAGLVTELTAEEYQALKPQPEPEI